MPKTAEVLLLGGSDEMSDAVILEEKNKKSKPEINRTIGCQAC